ncbi:MAG: hypothetical protein CHACPFDD_02753 [Phycisphaerae bacterium]|nr:hypothetical protein [Phycisphaerae bacterium]
MTPPPGERPQPTPPRRTSLLAGLLRRVQRSSAAWLERRVDQVLGTSGLLPPAAENERNAGGPAEPPAAEKRAGMLGAVAEKLRGAADTYVAAKLDEIEARVDVKLDEIEGRLDRKLLEIHEQLGDLRDREIRHRLRLLKITLAFTVLVALLSLGYKLLVRLWIR